MTEIVTLAIRDRDATKRKGGQVTPHTVMP